MSDRVVIPCPGCGHTLRVPAEYHGRRAICKRCRNTFKISIPGAEAPAGAAAKPTTGEPRATATWESGTALSAGLSETAASLERENALLREERDGFRNRFERTRSALAWARSEAEKLAPLLAEVDAIRAERDELLGVRDEASRLARELESSRNLRKEETGRLEEAAARSRRDWEAERQSLLDEGKARWDEGQRESDEHRGVAERLRSELEETHTTHQQSLEVIERARDHLHDDLEAARGLIGELEKAMDGLRDEVEAERRRADELADREKSAIERAGALEHDRDQDRAEWQVERARLEAGASSAHSLAARFPEIEAELAASRQRIEELTAQLATNHQYVQSMRSHLAGMGIRVPG